MQQKCVCVYFCAGFRIYQLWQTIAAGKMFCIMLIIQSNLSIFCKAEKWSMLDKYIEVYS